MEGLFQFFMDYFLLPARFIFVLFAWLIFVHLKRRLMALSYPSYIHAVLDIDDGSIRLPITRYETTIGRSKSCDAVIPLAFISRQHAVLTMTQDGRWRIQDTKSAGGIYVNGEEPQGEAIVGIGDEISLSGMKMVLMPPSSYDVRAIEEEKREKEESFLYKLKSKFTPKKKKKGSVNSAIIYLNFFQILACLQFFMVLDEEFYSSLLITFAFLFVIPWIYKLIAKLLKIKNMEAEIVAFFLTTLGICTTASAAPESLLKQLAAIVLGLVIFCAMCGILKNLQWVMKLRRYAGIASLLILAANIVFGVTLNGQRNWIRIGSMTIQPSEFVKILFIFTGAATLEWLLTTKNLTILTVYSVGCVGCLFLMGDFGTALIFFFTFLVLIFMTNGDIRAIILACVAAGLGLVMILSFKPYIMDRFASWRHVWDYVHDAGFQQTRALMAIASGGMLGLGGGNGFLQRIYAADTDIVFGLLAEEWGMIIAVLALCCYILLMVSAIRSHQTARSSYYVIAACTAGALILFQASLNVFGTTDILPITGVTLPFISNGGSSMAASWGMLSFITAALNYARPKKVNPLYEKLALEIEEGN